MEKTQRAAGTAQWDKTRPRAWLCDTANNAAGVPKGQKDTTKGTFHRSNWIPKSAFEFGSGPWWPGLKRMPRI